MKKNVLKLVRALLILLSLVLGFIAAFGFVWISETDSNYSQYYLDGIKFKNDENKIKFVDAINMACSFSEAYNINATDAMENQPFSYFFAGRDKQVKPSTYCQAITNLRMPGIITESILVICQLAIFIISALANSKVVQGAPDAVTLIKRLNYIALSCGICSIITLISVFYYSKMGNSLLGEAGIERVFSAGFYTAIIVILFPVGISVTYWYEGVLWHNSFEQDRLQWQSEANNNQNLTNVNQYNYIQVPTDFNTVMGGLQSPTEMARSIERNLERKEMVEKQ
ncbi:putative integral membrane protein [Cryptosporidium felis]|nr:putative integral membrane protein [Cryptosporidium felis]